MPEGVDVFYGTIGLPLNYVHLVLRIDPNDLGSAQAFLAIGGNGEVERQDCCLRRSRLIECRK